VVALDIRGHGESCKPRTGAEYGIERICDDILAVTDAAGASGFRLWGYSYGGNIGRYLAARSQRVERFAMIGVEFGPAADEGFRGTIEQMQEHWRPVLEAERDGTLDIGEIPERERGAWLSGQIPVMLALTPRRDYFKDNGKRIGPAPLSLPFDRHPRIPLR
jgi:pimeloyl-ACP methyl ester carboxylesterase